MIKKVLEKFIKQFSSKNLLKANLSRCLILLLFSPLLSCTDQGCIEADDFGEYQTQTFEVASNATEDSCRYDSSLALNDADQGSGIKNCIAAGAASVTDEGGITQRTSSGGCNGKQVNGSNQNIDINGSTTTDQNKMIPLDGPHINLCVRSCVESCQGGALTGGNSSPEPNWKSTDKRDSSRNYGVQILPGSQISITATGNITLSNSAIYPSIYIPVNGLASNGMQENYKNSNWTTNSLFDVAAGQSFSMKFSGYWNRACAGTTTNCYYNTNLMGGGPTALAASGAINTAIYDGAISLAAYTIPHPEGYNFDSSQTTEVLGNKGTPLLPEPATWTCDYNGAKNPVTIDATTYPYLHDVSCHVIANAYKNLLGYNESVDSAVAANSLFAITSNGPSAGLGFYGGPIRWNGDGLSEANGYNFLNEYSRDFTAISASELSIPMGSSVKADGVSSQVVGSQTLAIPAEGITFSNNDSSSYMLFARSNDTTCSTATNAENVLSVTVKDTLGNNIAEKVNIRYDLSYDGWGSYAAPLRISVDPGQKILIVPPASCTGAGKLAIKFQKLHDITVTQSGFVRFTTLNAGSSGTSCTLSGRILNKKNVDGSNRENNDPDYYEYDDFSAANSLDPLEQLSVPNSGTTLSWSNKIYVRKGQTLRFSPISWNDTFTGTATPDNVLRQCGIGMVMQITPRPALLCKGVVDEPVATSNPNCLPEIDLANGNLIGCQAYASECNTASNTSYFCPYTDCKSTIECNPGNETNLYTKSSCTSTPKNMTSACTSIASIDKQTACGPSYCSGKMLENAQLPAKTIQTLDKCYDLENYTGKVSSIPAANGSGPANTDPIFAKGAAVLENFSGYYGNFGKFRDTKTVDPTYNKNIIYEPTNSLTFSQNSRLKFFILTNNGDFRNLDQNYSTDKSNLAAVPYSSLSSRGSAYNGSNGVKINFEGTLQFANGQWLEARLCRETDTHSCRSIDVPSVSGSVDAQVNAQPHLVEYENPVSSSDMFPTLLPIANYKFDAFGTLSRVTAAGSKDCTILNQAVDTQIGMPYYCHTYLNGSSSYIYDPQKADAFSSSDYSELNQLRLIFKIKDPEFPNCIIVDSGSASDNGVKLVNPAYQGNACSTASNCIAGTTSTDCGAGKPVPCTGTLSGGNCVSTSSSSYDGYFSSSTVCSSNTGITGQTCTASDGLPSLSSSTPCRKQFYCANPYTNNIGKYFVTVKVSNPPGNNISNIIGGVITPVIETMDGKRTLNDNGSVTQTVGQSQRIYTLVVQDSRYQAILSMCMAMMIMFYGLTYLMGITDLSSSDLINRCVKIALIYFFASPTGWYWFNLFAVKWFKDGTDYLAFMMASSFDDSPSLARAISANDYYDKSVLFSSVDKVFGMFFSQAVQKKISALLFASIFGFIYLWIIYLSFMLYVYAVGYAVLYYLTAQIFISILFTLGPIFFIFTLFNQTKGMFDSWLNQLIGFSLQQIFLLTTLAFFNMMMYEVLKMSLGYKICWDEVWSINIITRISLLSFWTVASLPPKVNTQSEVGEIGHPEGIPSLFSILFIWVIASLMRNFIDFMTNLGATIGGSMKASAMASGVVAAISQAQKYSSEKFNDLKKATVGEAGKRLDAALFDSGEHADKARKERQDKNRQDQGKKESLSKAGNDAMSKFKRENAEAYSKMSETEKKAELTKARDAGMKAEAKKLGISDKDFEKLQKDKGLKYEGSNLLVAAAQAARQKAGYGGATLDKSLKDGKIDTKMSFSEAKEGMSKMSADQRKDFIKAAVSGDVKVDKSLSQKVIGTAQSAANMTAKPALGAAVGVVGAAAAMGAGAAKDIYTSAATGKLTAESSKAAASAVKDKAVRAAKETAKSASEGAGSVKDSLANKMKSLAGKAANAVGAGEFNAARKELVASGKIRKLALGSQSLGETADEKKMIQEKMEATREVKKSNMPQKNDDMTVAKLAALDKGMTKSESDPVKSTMGTLDEKIFGAGGASHAVRSQFEKSADAEKFKTESVSNMAGKMGAEKGSITTANADRKELVKSQEAAQKASSDIKQVQALEKKKAEPGANKEELNKKIDAVKAGSKYYQDESKMTDLKEKESKATTDEERKAIGNDIRAITDKADYVDSKGDGLENANSKYQDSSQQITNIDAKLAKTKDLSPAMEKSKAAFEKAMASSETKKTQESYSKLSAVDKATGGLFNKEARQTIKAHDAVQDMKKDYAKLGNLTERDTKINKGGKFDGKSKALAKHEEFAEKYGVKEPEPATETDNPMNSNASQEEPISLPNAAPSGPLVTIKEDEGDPES